MLDMCQCIVRCTGLGKFEMITPCLLHALWLQDELAKAGRPNSPMFVRCRAQYHPHGQCDYKDGHDGNHFANKLSFSDDDCIRQILNVMARDDWGVSETDRLRSGVPWLVEKLRRATE